MKIWIVNHFCPENNHWDYDVVLFPFFNLRKREEKAVMVRFRNKKEADKFLYNYSGNLTFNAVEEIITVYSKNLHEVYREIAGKFKVTEIAFN